MLSTQWAWKFGKRYNDKSVFILRFLVFNTGFPGRVFYFARYTKTLGLGIICVCLQAIDALSVTLSPFHLRTLLSLIIFECCLIDIIYEGYYLIFDLLGLFSLSHYSSRLSCDCSWHFNKKLSCADPKVPTTMCSESQVKCNRN